MYRDSISEEAQDALGDMLILEDFRKEHKIELVDALNQLIENFSEEERKTYIYGLKELRQKKYISIEPEPKFYSNKNICFKKLHINTKGRFYCYKFFERRSQYTIGKSEHEKTIDDTLLKITKGGFYIVITALITAITQIIDTLINVYNAFH